MPRNAMIVIGESGSGKTRRAIEEARKRGGVYLSTSWDEIKTPFGLGRVLKFHPKTVIVEGLSVSGKDINLLKHLASGDNVLIELKYEDPRMVPAPYFIFTMLTPPKTVFSPSPWRRFDVVEV